MLLLEDGLSEAVGAPWTCEAPGFSQRGRGCGCRAWAARGECDVCPQEALVSLCTPMTCCHRAPLHPWEAAGEGVSTPACAVTRWSCLQAASAQERLRARGFQTRLFISIPGVTTLHSGKKHPQWIRAVVFGAKTTAGSERANQGQGSSWAPAGLILLRSAAAFSMH